MVWSALPEPGNAAPGLSPPCDYVPAAQSFASVEVPDPQAPLLALEVREPVLSPLAKIS